MGSEKDRQAKALLDALKFETDGRAFFLEAAKKTSDYFGRIIFSSLADEERDHIERIKAIDRSLRDTQQWPTSEDHAEEGEKSIFETARMQMDKLVKDRTDDLQAVKIGMDLEQKAIRFYSSLALKASDQREKEFYERLVSEEKRHFQVLEETWRTLVEYSSSRLD